MYSPEFEDGVYQQNLMLTHPTNILQLDQFTNPPTSTDNRVETAEQYEHEDDDLEDTVEVLLLSIDFQLYQQAAILS